MAVGWVLGALWCLHDVRRAFSANRVNCTVTWDAERTTYEVRDVKASRCEYSWANTSGTSTHVLANHLTKMDELVKNTSISSLITSECFDNIIFTRNCVSEGTEYKANCTTNCTENGLLQENTHRDWIAAVIVLLLVLLMGLTVVLCYKYKIFKKKCCFSQHRSTYTVTTQSSDLETTHVEATDE